MKPDLFNIENKIIVLTGGLGLLGKEFTKALLAQKARVAVLDSADKGGTDHLSQDDDDRYLFVKADVRHKTDLQNALEHIENRWGTPEGLVNNAAMDSPPYAPVEENGPFEKYPENSWDAVISTNTKGPFLACQVFGSAMVQKRRGSIVNIGSIYGLVSPDQRIYAYRREGESNFFKPAAYGASKSALANLTSYLSTYWADKNVRVNTLTFGGVQNGQDEHFLNGYCSRVPLGRMAKPDEYTGALIFLLSDAATYMTGSNLIIDGGWTAW